jgi:hypothetical protein
MEKKKKREFDKTNNLIIFGTHFWEAEKKIKI